MAILIINCITQLLLSPPFFVTFLQILKWPLLSLAAHLLQTSTPHLSRMKRANKRTGQRGTSPQKNVAEAGPRNPSPPSDALRVQRLSEVCQLCRATSCRRILKTISSNTSARSVLKPSQTRLSSQSMSALTLPSALFSVPTVTRLTRRPRSCATTAGRTPGRNPSYAQNAVRPLCKLYA